MSQLLNIKGIGNKSLTLLNKLGIESIDDLVNHYPFRYDVLKKTSLDEKIVCTEGMVESIPTVFRFRGNMNKMSFRIRTEDNLINIIIFNRAFLKNNISIGLNIVVIGTYDKLKNTLIANNIKFMTLGESEVIEPVYRTVNGLGIKKISNYIKEVIDTAQNGETLPVDIIKKYNFIDRSEAIRKIHFPSNNKDILSARARLKYEELFLFMLKINYLKLNRSKEGIGLSRNVNKSDVDKFIDSLPFKLTSDQINASYEVLDDLNSSIRMNRLLQGDVSSGKTVVSVISMYANYLSGYQSAFMVPTEILAKQHYENVSKLLSGIDIKIEILTSSTKNKKEVYERLYSGDIDLIIGTHALIQEKVEYKNLGLVITDEQHRFGVGQREKLSNKGTMPDILYMSATPIPRTYALTIYGDMDISSIKTKPNGRKDIKTYIKSNSEIKEVLSAMHEELKLGHQIYVIAPLIEESELIDLTNVNEVRDKLKLAFKNYNIDVMHGKMKTDEKDKVMSHFVSGKVDILVSTTVIEVGVDNKNATMIVIFDSDRFGLSQLHQLRGRVGRNDMDAYCYLISDIQKERLSVLINSNDGFEISEQDFKLRGEGDLFGKQQSGDMNFKIANIRTDFDLLIKAKEDSMYILKKQELNDYLKLELKKLDNLN